LAGRDVIGCAETGTGKTAAYVLPVLSRLIREDREAGPRAAHHATRALILAPTRELATQIDDELQGFAYHAPVASAAVYGGVPMEPQERALKAGVDIVVATPGRLLDHMRSNVGDFSKVEIFILDEADRMMDMGFWPDVRKIAEAMPPSSVRQTMLFSATMPEEVMRFADALAPTSVFVQVGSRRGPASTITHEGRILPSREKTAFLGKYLRRHSEPTIVFVNTKIGCDRLARQLSSLGLRAVAVHADRSQEQRTGRDREFPHGPHQRARGHRCRRARPGHRRRDVDRQLRSAARPRFVRPSRRPHRPQRSQRPRIDACRPRGTPRTGTG
jgi:ATP-dependent RNA helicase RhlE